MFLSYGYVKDYAPFVFFFHWISKLKKATVEATGILMAFFMVIRTEQNERLLSFENGKLKMWRKEKHYWL